MTFSRPAPPISALRASTISKAFMSGTVRVEVLTRLDLDIHAGQMTLISGPSGCGKSTLLSLIGGLQRPDGGTIHAMGIDLSSLSPRALARFRLRHTGFVFQGFNLFSALTAVEQVALPLRYLGMKSRQAEHRALDVLRDVGIHDLAYARPFQLSGGQKQRVAIARALAKGPSLLFADEPTSALDAENGQTVTALLKDIAHQRGAIVVCVSHDPRMTRHADRVISLEDGRIRTDTGLLSHSSQSLS